MRATTSLGRRRVSDPALLTAAVFGYGVAGSMTIPFLALFFVGQLHVAQPVFALFSSSTRWGVS